MEEREALLQSEVGGPCLNTAVQGLWHVVMECLVQRESAWRAEGSAEAQRASEVAAVQDQVGFPCAGARQQCRLVTEA